MPQIRVGSDLEKRVVSSAQIAILQIKSLGWSIVYSRKSVKPRIEPWETLKISWISLEKIPIQNHPKTPVFNWISLESLPIQNHRKPCIFEERKNKAKYLTWNSIRLTFVKKTSVPSSVKSLEYIKRYSTRSPRLVKSHRNSIRYNCQKICSWSRRPKTTLEIRKKDIIYKFLKNFKSNR